MTATRALYLFSLMLLLSCANPLNKNTYFRYLDTGAQAEARLDSNTAEIAYSRALGNVYMGNLGSEREAEALFNLGRMERVNGKYDSALEHLLSSLEIDETINNAEPKIIKSTLGEIATTYYDMGEYLQGLPYLDRLYSMDEDVFYSEQSNNFIDTLFSDYAKQLRKLGMAEQAEIYEIRSAK